MRQKRPNLFVGQNTALHNQKRKLELELQMVANEVDEGFDEGNLINLT